MTSLAFDVINCLQGKTLATAESWTGFDGENYPNVQFFDITYEHARRIREEGSLEFEVPFRTWKFDSTEEEKIQYLLVTVVEEDGTFKVSDCKLKQ